MYIILQSTPTYANEVDGYCVVAPVIGLFLCFCFRQFSFNLVIRDGVLDGNYHYSASNCTGLMLP